MRGSVSTRVSTRAAATGVVPAPTTGAVVLQHSFIDGIFYKGTDVQQVRVSAVVRLQAAARVFLARRRLQKAHKQMRDREAPLAVVAFDAKGCDLDSLDGQLCRSADVSKGAHGVFPVDGVLQLRGDGGRRGVFLLVASGDALPSASAFRLRPPVRVRFRDKIEPLLRGQVILSI
jgi:hypothetical protein